MNNDSHVLAIRKYFDQIAKSRDSWKRKSKYYHRQTEKLLQFLIPQSKRVLEIGCGTGDLLNSVKPNYGMGIDIAPGMIIEARKKYRKLHFKVADGQNLSFSEKFDYIIFSDVIGNFEDVQKALSELHKVSDEKTKIIITTYSFLWEPILNLAEKLGLKMPQPSQNWLAVKDIENLLFLANFEVVRKGTLLLLPISIPLVSDFINTYIARLPLIKNLCLVEYFVVRKSPNIYNAKEYSVSVVIPARNEAGNIEQAIVRTPKLGSSMEFVFVEGWSKDNTLLEIKRVINKYQGKREITLVNQGNGVGKANAMRKGFARAKGDILMVLDADLTVAPEVLPSFYQAIRSGKGELIMGSRLVYPMEKQAMRFLNILGNKFFSLIFSFLLDQPIKDTLCGTKVLFKKDYEEIAQNRTYFGDFDPFGDYDLIFGATKLNLRIVEIPIRYRARTYGTTNISRFRHGLLLLRMTFFAAKRLKFV